MGSRLSAQGQISHVLFVWVKLLLFYPLECLGEVLFSSLLGGTWLRPPMQRVHKEVVQFRRELMKALRLQAELCDP